MPSPLAHLSFARLPLASARAFGSNGNYFPSDADS